MTRKIKHCGLCFSLYKNLKIEQSPSDEKKICSHLERFFCIGGRRAYKGSTDWGYRGSSSSRRSSRCRIIISIIIIMRSISTSMGCTYFGSRVDRILNKTSPFCASWFYWSCNGRRSEIMRKKKKKIGYVEIDIDFGLLVGFSGFWGCWWRKWREFSRYWYKTLGADRHSPDGFLQRFLTLQQDFFFVMIFSVHKLWCFFLPLSVSIPFVV